MNHTVIHFEIPADDVEKLKGFYSAVFGWKLVDIPEMEYVSVFTVPTDESGMLKEPGVNGGIYRRTRREQVPVNYISVESVDEYVKKAEANGGTVLQAKQSIAKVGEFAWIADPEGNPIGIIRPEM